MTPRLLIAALLLLSACGRNEGSAPRRPQKLTTHDVAAAPKAEQATTPQIAYAYTVGYALAPDRIAAAQARHVALCRGLGTARCLVLQTDLNRGTDDTGMGTTKMMVAAPLAVRFGERLDAVVGEAGGTLENRSVAAEDVTKQLVDTGARIRAKQALADRLLSLIQSAKGNVGDLVAAEKAYADVQEELDAARGLEAALRGRVAMSEITISYTARAHAGAFGPVARAFSDAGRNFMSSLGAALSFAIAAIPWLAIFGLIFYGGRAVLRRWRRRRGTAA